MFCKKCNVSESNIDFFCLKKFDVKKMKRDVITSSKFEMPARHVCFNRKLYKFICTLLLYVAQKTFFSKLLNVKLLNWL